MLRRIFKSTSIFVLVIGLVAGIALVRNEVNIRSRASGTPANLVIDMRTSFENANSSWRYLAQGGEERGRSLAPVVSQVRNLNPAYIRVDHIYDFFPIVSRNGQGQLSYNWTEFDAYIRDIQATGAKPFLALSYNPPIFGKDTDMPDLSAWRALVQATIEHVSGRGGLNISDVYYEVWNEPDLFGQFKVYPPKDYRDLYKASSDAALAARNTQAFKIGGPATTSLYKNWFDALATMALDGSIRFDFFSWHSYAEDPDVLRKQLTEVNRWVSESGIPGLELFVTEHGITSSNSPAYDSNLSAYNTLMGVALTADSAKGLFSFEIKDGPGPQQYWGRWGILTHEKYGTPVAKPRYRALEFLKSMTGARLNIAGNGSWVQAFARQDQKSTKIFVVNYDLEGKHVEAVPMRITGIPFERFTFARRDFQGGSTQVNATSTNGEYQTIQYFRANQASIFEITALP